MYIGISADFYDSALLSPCVCVLWGGGGGVRAKGVHVSRGVCMYVPEVGTRSFFLRPLITTPLTFFGYFANR
jgi:hypothetical protein